MVTSKASHTCAATCSRSDRRFAVHRFDEFLDDAIDIRRARRRVLGEQWAMTMHSFRRRPFEALRVSERGAPLLDLRQIVDDLQQP